MNYQKLKLNVMIFKRIGQKTAVHAFLSFILLWACQPKNRLELISPFHSGIDFTNELVESEVLNILNFEYFYNGAGVGIGDFNNDGLEDIFFTSNMGKSALYINQGNFRFKAITVDSGIDTYGKWATGVSVIDINQDGLLDIYVCFSGPYEESKRKNELYINNGDHTFVEKASEFGLADTSHSVQAAFFDFDKDGLLDMYLLNNMTDATGPNVIRKKRVNGQMPNTDKLYRNKGDGTFSDVSDKAGITIEGYGLGVSITDINQDGWPDIYVSNDYLSNDLLYINQQDGTFLNQAAEAFRHTSYSAMGNDVGDFNNDGLADIITVDMLPPDNYRQKMMFGKTSHERYRSEIANGYDPQFMRNTLQLNRGVGADQNPRFSEISQLAEVSATDWSWSPLWVDLDNDGWKDLMITNGYPKDITNLDFVAYKASVFSSENYSRNSQDKLLQGIKNLEGALLPNRILKNNQDLTFSDKSTEWGFTQSEYSSGAAYADFNNDGLMDVVITNTGAPAHLYRNNSLMLNYVQILLKGPKNNLQGIGTKIKVYSSGMQQYYEHFLTRGYQSSMSQIIHFGLGKERIDSIGIVWPNDKKQLVRNVPVNTRITIEYNPDRDQESLLNADDLQADPGIFYLVDTTAFPVYHHKETYFSDFNVQPLLPHKLSQNGPGIAVGDVNDDGLEDYFVGGAFRQSGEFFIQNVNGSFARKKLSDGNNFEEDMGCLLVDLDNDGDLDLYIVSGGNEFKRHSPFYQDRIYLNDGKGNFEPILDLLPEAYQSGSCVVASDFDGDGDIDLFVGGRLSPQNYPETGNSMLLENRNDKFLDVTDELAPGLKQVGMVTSAIWTDYDNDGFKDLILVGEWMPITVYRNIGGRFENYTSRLRLEKTRGWWNSILGVDLDSDGDVDYILGNLGSNSRYRTTVDGPLSIHIGDFDNNGGEEAIISHFIGGKRYPIHPRDDLFQQIPSLKKRFPSFDSYGKATVETLFPLKDWENRRELSVDVFSSAVLINTGDIGFDLMPLPNEAQISPVYGIESDDFNGDGLPDLFLTGNSNATEVLTGNYDSSYGQILFAAGNGKFKPGNMGVFLEGEARGVSKIFGTNQGCFIYLVANSNDDLVALRPFESSKQAYLMDPEVDYALLRKRNGTVEKREFYLGAGYLSQSSRKLVLGEEVVAVELYNGLGTRVKVITK